MENDVYELLALHLDDLPGGYPRTSSGVEIRILRQLFSPQEAELARHLTLIAEEPRVIARRARQPLEEVTRRLEEMEKKGLIYCSHQKNKPSRYMAQQFVIGFWEGQVNNLTPALVRDFEEYLPIVADLESWRRAPQLRTIPIGESIPVQTRVMPYENAKQILQAYDVFAVRNCICRQELRIMGKGCDRPEETCLSLGAVAENTARSGKGRLISREEAQAMLLKADENGLVLQPTNDKNPVAICMCCGCCCGILRSVKRHPKPSSVVSSSFFAVLDVGSCSGCGICTTRCQMDALTLLDGCVRLDLDRCIGCGLCVTTCTGGALSLQRKPAAAQPKVPRSIAYLYIQLGRARGKMRLASLASMLARSVLDRLRG